MVGLSYASWRKHYLDRLREARRIGMPRDTLVSAQMALVRLRTHVGPGPH